MNDLNVIQLETLNDKFEECIKGVHKIFQKTETIVPTAIAYSGRTVSVFALDCRDDSLKQNSIKWLKIMLIALEATQYSIFHEAWDITGVKGSGKTLGEIRKQSPDGLVNVADRKEVVILSSVSRTNKRIAIFEIIREEGKKAQLKEINREDNFGGLFTNLLTKTRPSIEEVRAAKELVESLSCPYVIKNVPKEDPDDNKTPDPAA